MGFVDGLATFARDSRRMISVATLPRYKEFERIVKITGAGVVLIGVVGVLIMAVLGVILG